LSKIEIRIVVCFTHPHPPRRFAHYKSKIHHIWNASFHPETVIDTKLIVGTRNNSNLTKELVRRSPRVEEKEKGNNQQLQ
jgi:hypothetical protein